MINIGDQLYVNNKWYFDIIGVINNQAIIQVYYMWGYPKQQISRKTFRYNLKDLFVEADFNTWKEVSVDENKLRNVIGVLIDQILIQGPIYEYCINEESGVAMATTAVSGMGAVVSPGVSSTPGVSGSAGSDIAVSASLTDLNKSYKKKQKNKGLIDTRWSNKSIKEIIKIGKKINNKIESPLYKLTPNMIKPISVINSNESLSIELTEDEFKTKLLDFIKRPFESDIEKALIEKIEKIKDNIIKNPKIKTISFLKRLKNENQDVFNKCSTDFNNNYNIFLN